MSHFVVIAACEEHNLFDVMTQFQESPEEGSEYRIFECKIKKSDLQSEFDAFKADPENKEYADRYSTAEEWACEYFGYDKEGGDFGWWTNPNGKWDWYSIGGRWQGYFKAKDGVECKLGESGAFDSPKPEDLIGMSDIIKKGDISDIDMDKLCPFAFITEDGEWHEKGKMGMWGIVSYENGNVDGPFESDKDMRAKFVAEFTEWFNSLPDDQTLIAVDCHT